MTLIRPILRWNLFPYACLLASGGGDSCIKIWDVVTTGGIKATFTGRHKGTVMFLAVVPRTTLLASCSGDKSVKVWE